MARALATVTYFCTIRNYGEPKVLPFCSC